MSKPLNVYISIIVPLKQISRYLVEETIPAILKQTYQNFEIIVLPDKPTGEKFPKTRIIPTWPKVGPAQKRNLGAQKARGEILAFIDDDAYPDKNWLQNAVSFLKPSRKNSKIQINPKPPTLRFSLFKLLNIYKAPPLAERSIPLNRSSLAAVCGPGVTPPHDPLLAQVSGWMWASFLGSGGAGRYRCWPQKRQMVDDFPTFNLLVRKSDFLKVGGFNANFWPGEDTKLCHDLVYRLGKKIIYDPKILVYHHRRKIFKDHLKQIGRYGLHRGFFVKILPKTSKRIGYFLPLFFSAGVFLGPACYLLFSLLKLSLPAKATGIIYLSVMGLYFLGLLLTGFWVLLESKNILAAILVMPTIFVSHLFYGIMFFKGLSKKAVKSKFSREEI